MKHLKAFEGFLKESNNEDEQMVIDMVKKVLTDLGYKKRGRFITIKLVDLGGLYSITMNGKEIIRALQGEIITMSDRPQSLESRIKEAIQKNPNKFGL
jgi:hypothetical protein